MKICCDKCEKVFKRNALGELLNKDYITVHHLMFTQTINLCEDCMKKFYEFLKEKDDET